MFSRYAVLILVSLSLRVALIAYNGIDLNHDEQANWKIAENHLSGLGYTFNGSKTSFHSSSCVLFYEGLQLAGISRRVWEWFCTISSLALFIISIFYFHRLAKFINEKYAFWPTLLYIFYPANFYIGSLQFYENMVLPAMVILVAIIAEGIFVRRSLKWQEWLFIVVIVILSSYLRYVTLIIYLFLFTVCIILFKEYRTRFALLILILIAAQVPALIKTYNQFGAPLLSTQTGFELMQGHSDLARGSLWGSWSDETNPYYKYSRIVIPGLDSMNELEESKARAAFALNWIKENPLKELVLIARKVAIYFSPLNYKWLPTSNWYNPVNLAVHLGFLVFCFRFRRSKENYLLIAIPMACLLITIIFFVVYRVRFFAEPFMILCALQLFHQNQKAL